MQARSEDLVSAFVMELGEVVSAFRTELDGRRQEDMALRVELQGDELPARVPRLGVPVTQHGVPRCVVGGSVDGRFQGSEFGRHKSSERVVSHLVAP